MAAAADVALLVDGDGLVALAPVSEVAATFHAHQAAATVLTPHDGEMHALHRRAAQGRTGWRPPVGWPPIPGAVVLLKGPSTVVAAPDGAVHVVANGDQRLAAAGLG